MSENEVLHKMSELSAEVREIKQQLLADAAERKAAAHGVTVAPAQAKRLREFCEGILAELKRIAAKASPLPSVAG